MITPVLLRVFVPDYVIGDGSAALPVVGVETTYALAGEVGDFPTAAS
jgi:hypothetical protein